MSETQKMKIEQIIKKRSMLAERVRETRAKLSQLNENVSLVINSYNSVNENLQDECFVKLRETLSALTLLNSSEAPIIFKDVENLLTRLTRTTLNIAAIGEKRQGKSRLLRSISGLNSSVLPESDDGACTAVPSWIENRTDLKETKAEVFFLTGTDYLKILEDYFNDIKDYCRPFAMPQCKEDFERMNLEELYDEKLVPYTVREEVRTAYETLVKYQKNFKAYKDKLDRDSIVVDEEEIKEYVAQYDPLDSQKKYYNYMAVDKVKIFCKYNVEDVGNLQLVDLAGLGELRKGLDDKLIKVMGDEVDLAFFVRRPGAGGDQVGSSDMHVYQIAKQGLEDKLPIEDWSFLVLNHDKVHGDNEKQCRSFAEETTFDYAKKLIVDCSDSDEVSTKLITPALEFLEGHIVKNDKRLAQNIEREVVEYIYKVKDQVGRALELLSKDDDNKQNSLFRMLFKEVYRNLKRELQRSVNHESELFKKRDLPCEDMQEALIQIFREEEGLANSHPAQLVKEEEIKELDIEYGGLFEAFQRKLHELRTRLGAAMRNGMDNVLDKVQNDMKDQLGNILAVHGKLENRFGRDRELLDNVVKYLDENEDLKKKTPTLYDGFVLLHKWKMSYRSFVQHRIYKSLLCLDPQAEENQKRNGDLFDSALKVAERLNHLYVVAINDLRTVFEAIYPEPNGAAYTTALEFKDIIIRQGDADDLELEWGDFYESIKQDVWNEFADAGNRQAAVRQLQRPLENARDCLERVDLFRFLN